MHLCPFLLVVSVGSVFVDVLLDLMKHEPGKAVVFMCCEDAKENKNFNFQSVLSSWLLSNHSFSPEVFLQKWNLSVSYSFSLAFFFFEVQNTKNVLFCFLQHKTCGPLKYQIGFSA